ncbi:MAG: TlpA disulfide reductase family protein [Bacteroidia bacterium]|nr:TlpA disulfide reductase family protein [Bacteroidia bacterium]
MQRLLLLALGGLLLAACGPATATDPGAPLSTGTWRAVVRTQGIEVPFLVEVATPTDSTVQLTLRNADERLVLDPAPLRGDSLTVPIDIFDAELRLRREGATFVGTWVKPYAPGYELPIYLTAADTSRFPLDPAKTPGSFGGRYATTFTHEDGHTSQAVGLFQQQGAQVTGTFLTKTGDYRYLAGIADGDSLRLSTFNGEWAYLFVAGKLPDGTLQGTYYTGKSGRKTFSARLDSTAQLPDANTLAYLKPGAGGLRFSFPGTAGDTVTYPSPAFAGKPVVVQIFGTWCPNCRDETVFLADWYRRNQARGVEVIALAFERNPAPEYANARIEKMRQKLDVRYRFAVAGESTSEAASKALPMLSSVLGFPTTIFIDKAGRVRKIHTGFSGPGTGEAYSQFVAEFTATMEQLLAE